MKILPYILPCFLILTSVLIAQAETDKRIATIRKWYTEVEGDKKLKPTTFKSPEENMPHSLRLTRYLNAKGELQKLYVVNGGEHGESRTTYYFKDGKLFFVYEGTNEWRFTGEETADGQSEVIDIASEYRFYFDKSQCIKALEKRVELIGADELNDLLKQKPNKEIPVVAAIQAYHKKAMNYAAIKTQDDFTKFLNAE